MSGVVPLRRESGLMPFIASYRRHLKAANRADSTLNMYEAALIDFVTWGKPHGVPEEPAAIIRQHVEAYMVDLMDRVKPATANGRYRVLHGWFKWLAEAGGADISP